MEIGKLKKEFYEFSKQIESRLRMGSLQYGDRSFNYDPEKLVQEIREELWDICGWSFILCQRLEKVSTQLSRLGKAEKAIIKMRSSRDSKK